jgi:hypothetical protein
VPRYEWILLAVSVVAILWIFGAALWAGRGGIKLPHPVIFALRIVLGVIFLILGVIGGFVPVMQGWIFILLGILVLFPESKFAIKALDKVQPKMPRMVAWLRKRGVGVPREERDESPEQ